MAGHRINPPPGTLAAGGLCRHKAYRFMCTEFDRLFERSGARCEICRKPGNYSTPLQIDHDHDLGIWAVRGLICPGCNSYELPYGRLTDAAHEYLKHPWYQQMAKDAGVPLSGPPEPGLGGCVIDRIGRRRWTREHEGWVTPHRHPYTWAEVVSLIGPHNAVILSDPPLHRKKSGYTASASMRRHIPVRLDSPESAAETLRKHMPPEQFRTLVRLLTEEHSEGEQQ